MKLEYLENAAQIIRKRRQKLKNREDFRALLRRIILVALIFFIVFHCLLTITRISGNAMFPSVRDGDIVIGYMAEKNFQRDDIITYRSADNKLLTGRILCAGDDVIYIDEDGFLYVNGTRQTGIVMKKSWFSEIEKFPYVIPANYVLVSVDVLTDTTYEKDKDYSSYVAMVKKTDIKSKTICIVRRRGF